MSADSEHTSFNVIIMKLRFSLLLCEGRSQTKMAAMFYGARSIDREVMFL